MLVEMCKVEELPGATVTGLKVATAPAGRPLMLRATLPAKPLTEPVATVKLAELPAITLCPEGEAVKVKFGGGLTASVTERLWTSAP